MPPLEHAPDLLGASGWCNVERPIDLRHDLAGQVAVLLFFAPSCVHSRHALATMALLDARFAGRPLSVLGVATPRDSADTWLEDVLHSLGVRFPIAVDAEHRVFEAYGCGVWPTLVVVDGTGRVRFHGGGEPDPRALTEAVKTLLAEVEYAGYGSMAPAAARLEAPPSPLALAQPAGLAVDVAQRLLWIADTGHHRLLAVDADSGTVRRVLGCLPGASDGDADAATFYAPRGLWFDGATRRLIVADTGNHLLRAVDADGRVTTLLGTGARAFDRHGGSSGVGQGLASPWAVAGADDELVLAVTGLHQIWSMRLADGVASARVGTGYPGRTDGMAAHARLSEPQGIAGRGDEIVICDFNNHALRIWDRAKDAVTTLLGGPESGDVDGAFAGVRLHYPSAVVWHGEDLIVADSGNGKLKRVDRARSEVATLAVGVELARPTALAIVGDRLFVADSARDRVVVGDLQTGAAHELEVRVPSAAVPSAVVRLRAQADCVVKIALALPPGASVHPDTAVRVVLRTVTGQALAADLTLEAAVEGSYAVARGLTTAASGTGVVRAELLYHTRHGLGRVAHGQHVVREATFTLDPDAPTMAQWNG